MQGWTKYWDNWIRETMRLPAGASPFVQIVLVLVIGLIVWLVIKGFLYATEKRVADHPLIKDNRQIFSLIRRICALGLWLTIGTVILYHLHFPILIKIWWAVFIVLIAFPLKKVLLFVFTFLEKRIADNTATKVDDIVFDLLNQFSGIFIFLTAVLVALDVLGINVMPFIAGAGVAGIAIGFAAKDTLSNIIAGVLLIIDRPFEIGDRIEVWSAPKGSASWGDVIDVGLRATKIKTTDNIIVVIPNNEIMTRDIINYTLIDNKIRVRINIGVSYASDIDKAKKIILDTVKTVEWIAPHPPPQVVVRNFGESSVEMQIRVWINNARKRMATISTITDRVKSAFDREGVEIPFPRRDINVIGPNKDGALNSAPPNNDNP
jgi:small-conductance mechanosensitive channel